MAVKSHIRSSSKRIKKMVEKVVEQEPDDHENSESDNNDSVIDDSVEEDSYNDHDVEEESSADDDVLEPMEHELESSLGKRSRDVNSEEETTEISTPLKKKRKSNAEQNKPPSAEEVARLRETENLFHSNLFRFQIEEMLSEVRVKKNKQALFASWFSSLQSIIMKMSVKKECKLTKQKWLRKLGVSVPILQQLQVEGTFQFIPPVSVYITGSYAVDCSLGPHINADIAIEMPKECFENRDIVNERYHRKRALYLCCIMAHLISSDVVSKKEGFCPKFTLSHDANPLVPVAEIVPAGPLEGRATVHLHITTSEETFKLTRLNPSKNSIREGWYSSDKNILSGEGTVPTPWCNASILRDLVAKSNEALRADVLKDSPAFKDAILLLKVWLKQRELNHGFCTFGSYLLSMLVVYLVRCRRLSAHMSSYQITRTVWNFLKDQDWTAAGGGISLNEKPSPGTPSLQEFHDHYDVVFVDCTGYCNLAAHLDTTSFLRIKKESARALQFLDDSSVNSFNVLFMTPMPFIRYFDHVLCFYNTEEISNVVSKIADKQQLIDGSQHCVRLGVKLLLSVLQKGLGKRVAEMGVKVPNHPTWSVDTTPVIFNEPILIGLNLNSEHAFSILDKGPPANVPEAEEFRTFWGNKSELRRFQDGSISEAVLWLPEKNVTFAERRLVCRSVVKYLLKQKLNLKDENVFYFADQVEFVLHCPNVKPASFSYGTGEEATLSILSSLNSLSSTLRGLSDLPLDITSIQGISPVCRYADVTPPLSTTHRPRNQYGGVKGACMAFKTDVPLTRLPPLVSPVEVILQMALSGKWPDDAEAVKRVRAAFNINIEKCLQNKGLSAQAFPNHVDVLKDGFVFRLRVAYGREASLLRLRKLANGVVASIDCKEAQLLERDTLTFPRITGYLHGLHQQFPAFGPTACLVKRWMAAHLFRFSHFPEIVLELLVAYLFIKPEPYLPPTQPQTAFLRFLHMISSTNWYTEPIIVNFNDELNKEELREIERRFTAERQQLPPIFLATPADHERSRLTKEAPILTILVRLAVLAAESLKLLQSTCLSQAAVESDQWKQVFRPSLDAYNVLIHLDPHMNSRRAWRIDNDMRNKVPKQLKPYKKTEDELIPITGFDPVELYITELEECYGDFALFFHDMFGGTTIGVVWKPNAMESKEFKVSHVKGRKLDPASKKLVLNKEAIIEDFYIIGNGLVKSIDLLDHSL